MNKMILIKKSYAALLVMILLVAILMPGCNSTSQEAKNGDTVFVHYTGKLQDGTEFDSSIGSDPLEFTLGEGQIMPAFEQAVLGMKIEESKTFTIPVDEAYGPRRDDLIVEINKDELPEELEPVVGMLLQMDQGNGESITVTVTEVSETTITIDANHSLAGHDLIFDITLVGIGDYQSSSQESSLTSIPLGQTLSNGLPTLAELGSSTCIPCKQMKPILEKLAVDYKGKLNVVIIDVYEQMELARQYEIMAIPTQIVFDSNGKEVTRHIGVWSREDIVIELKKMGIE